MFKLLKYFLVYILLHFYAFLGCSAGQEGVKLPLSDKFVKFYGKIKNSPSLLKKDPLQLRIRFYNCPDSFGKINPDTGIPTKTDCLKFYSEEIFSIKKDYSVQASIPKSWTHAFLQLEGLEEIHGLYSSGDNPYWITLEDWQDRENDFLVQHDFEFESMENPIPDSMQEKMASKFAPIIVLKKDKKYKPSNLEKFFGKYTVEINSNKKSDSSLYEILDLEKDKYISLDESQYEKGNTHLYYHVRYANTFVSGTNSKALPGFRDNRNYRYSKGDGSLVISYYFWYDYNEGPSPMGNRHEGDMESFAIFADANGNPKRLMVTGHNHVMLDTEWKNINSFENHPLIFIAHGNKEADGGNPSSPYGGYEVSLEAGNSLFNALANPKDIFLSISAEANIILPQELKASDLKKLRIGPGEWIDSKKTNYVDAESFVIGKIEKLVKWEEPGWINKPADKDPDKHHRVEKEIAWFLNFGGRIGKHPRSSLNIFRLAQYGRSPVNPPFKMNGEQHFTLEKPSFDRCEKARVGDYCPKFQGDSKTPQFK